MPLAMGYLVLAVAASGPCLNYGPATLTGTLVRQSIPDPDTRQSACWHFVELVSPACVVPGNQASRHERAHEGVRRVQLWHPDRMGYEQAHELNGQHVTCEGALFGRRTHQHHTPVLLHGTCVRAERDPGNADLRP